MTDFKGIRGWKVQTLSTDPVASAIATGSWASGENLPGQRYLAGSAGTVSSNLQAGGATQPPANSNQINTSIEFDGTNWTAGGTMNTTRFDIAGFGATNTAAIMAGGAANPGSSKKAVVESYDGSTFTEVADLNTARTGSVGIGISTAGLVVGGVDAPGTYVGNTESWNGSAWTEVNDLNSGRENAMSGGTSTAAIAAGGTYGSSPYVYALTEQWDGSNWTEVSDLNTGRPHGGSSGSDYTDVLVFGGGPPNVTVTEFWNGSSWTEVADLSNGRNALGGSPAGSSSSAIAAGGNPSPYQYTELWTTASSFQQLNLGQVYFNSTANAFKVTEQPVPSGSWSSGTNLNTVREFHAMAASSSDAAIAFGGNPGSTANTEQYDGSSWTEKNNLNTGRNSLRGFGTVSAAIGAGGYAPPGTMDNVESWDGTNWTEVNEINSARQLPGRGGTQTAGILFGGYTTAKSAVTETWDGTSWTEVADMNTSGDYISSFGSQTSAIAGNRYQPGVSPGYTENNVETWNGTSWTETAEMNTARAEMSGELGITGDLGLIAGGTPNGAGPAKIANTELWNGSSWTEVSDLGTARRNYGAGGPSASGILTGGDGDTDGTEEWTVALSNKTITVS